MRNIYIDLKDGRLVKAFVNAVSSLEGRFELVSDRTILDAKSILGIYSLDLSKPILLQVEFDTEENMKMLQAFAVR